LHPHDTLRKYEIVTKKKHFYYEPFVNKVLMFNLLVLFLD